MVSSTRSPTRTSTRLFAAALCLALAAPGVVWAKDSREENAKAKFEEGKRDYDLGRFKEALDAYTEAYELKPLPGLLFNIAQCHRQLHRWERASFFFRRYLDLSTTKPENAQVVNDLIAECDAKQTEVDKERARQAEESKQVELARAEAAKVEAEAQARRQEEARAEREEQARRLLLFQSTPPPAPTPDKPLYKRWWFWTAVGVAAAGAATATYFQVTASPTNWTYSAR